MKGFNNVVSSNGNASAQKFKYNGVEFEESLGLNLYEMEVRNYDPAIGRFNGIDPVVHYSQGTSVAFDNNPIFWADPSGADSDKGISGSAYEEEMNRMSESMRPQRHVGGPGDPDPVYSGPGAAVGNATNLLDEFCVNCSGTAASALGSWSSRMEIEEGEAGKYHQLIGMSSDATWSSYYSQKANFINQFGGGTYESALGNYFQTTDAYAREKRYEGLSLMNWGYWFAESGMFAMGAGGGVRPTIFSRSFRFYGISAKTSSNLADPFTLNPTHNITRSRTTFQSLVNDIKANGVRDALTVARNNGSIYIQNGHHRAYIAKRLGIKNVPIREIPFQKGMDIMQPGKNPGYLPFIKY